MLIWDYDKLLFVSIFSVPRASRFTKNPGPKVATPILIPMMLTSSIFFCGPLHHYIYCPVYFGAVGLFRSDILLIFNMVLPWFFLRDSLCLSAVSLARQRHDILDFSCCPLSAFSHVTLANWQRFGFEFPLRSSSSAFSEYMDNFI